MPTQTWPRLPSSSSSSWERCWPCVPSGGGGGTCLPVTQAPCGRRAAGVCCCPAPPPDGRWVGWVERWVVGGVTRVQTAPRVQPGLDVGPACARPGYSDDRASFAQVAGCGRRQTGHQAEDQLGTCWGRRPTPMGQAKPSTHKCVVRKACKQRQLFSSAACVLEPRCRCPACTPAPDPASEPPPPCTSTRAGTLAAAPSGSGLPQPRPDRALA